MEFHHVGEVIEKLNVRVFGGRLQIRYFSGSKTGYGPHVWVITYGPDSEELNRICWLNKDGSFELRHGCNGSLEWWWDAALLNEIAVEFDGYITDDGVEAWWPGQVGRYDTLDLYLDESTQGLGKLAATGIQMLRRLEVPKEFRTAISVDTGMVYK